MKRFLLILALVGLLFGIFGGSKIFLGSVGSIKGLLSKTDVPPPTTETPESALPLTIPEGFSIEVFADNLPSAREFVFDQFGNMWVSQMKEGKVSLVEIGDDGAVARTEAIFSNLNNPHGLAFDPENPFLLYVAEEDRVSRVATYSEGTFEKIADLPSGGNHVTRTISFGPDGRLYVSIGSSCNVCEEADERRGTIISMEKDGSDQRVFATGLRNSVFFDWHPVTGELWATDNGRDLLGDDTPPDEINIVREGEDYGWPICYGKQIHDTNFDKKQYIRNPCEDTVASYIDIQAHSAVLGISFIPEGAPDTGWPEEYWNDAVVAFHGSWNRSVQTGYKLVRLSLSNEGEFLKKEDLITGFIDDGGSVWGRPVSVHARAGGELFFSDDRAGVIYRLYRSEE